MAMMGLFIGELVFLAASISFLGELRGRSTPPRPLAWPAAHLLLVLAGLELAAAPMFDAAALAALATWLPSAIGIVFGVGNMFGLAILPLFALKTYPEHPGAMARETLTPLVVGLASAWLAPWLTGAEAPVWTAGLLDALVFLGLHHLTLLGLSLVQTLLDPPAHGAAAGLSLRERLRTFEGRLLFGIALLGIAEAVLVVALQARAAFSEGVASGVALLVLLALSVGEALRMLGRRADMTGGALWRR
jgi:hypothetical protein